ncbi:hypothetical protein CMI47_20280 [Candidatus Pacearchaeota archaeon]|nr:hypothetical protein [Candidatus Pacearchaeota archaeon]
MNNLLDVLAEDANAVRAFKRLYSDNEWTLAKQTKLLTNKRLCSYWRLLKNAGLPVLSMKAADLKRQDLSYLDFSGMDLRKTDFRSADLQGTRFDGCRLTRADFRKADLAGATFVGAQAYRADFRLARMMDTDFTGALLREVKMDKGAHIIRRRKAYSRKAPTRNTMQLICPNDGLENHMSGSETLAVWKNCIRDFGVAMKNGASSACILMGLPTAGRRKALLDSDKKYDVVFEATLATPMARAPLIAIAEMFECPLSAVFWEIDINVCLYENSIREHKLPTNYLYELNKTMTAPDMIEGFSSVSVVSVHEIGGGKDA